jgi:hypothetical protein
MALCILRHHLREIFRRRNFLLLHQYSMSLRMHTASLTEILKFQRTPNLLANHGLLFKLRESHRLNLLSLLVLVNTVGFA